MGERRHLERFNLVVPARLVVHNSRRKKIVYETNTCNISSGGAFFKTNKTLPEGTKVELDFVIPVEKLQLTPGVSSFVKVSGKVIRSDHEGIAICFESSYEIMPFRNL
jgi:hypothetical protein